MRNLRVAIIILISSTGLASLSHALFQVPTAHALGGIAIIVLALGSVLGVPMLQKRSVFFSATIWLVTYLFLQLALLRQTPWNNPWFIPNVIVEVLLLLVVIGLAYKVNKWLRQLDAQLSWAEILQIASRVDSLDEVQPRIDMEMARSRLYERPLAVIAFQIDYAPAAQSTAGLLGELNGRILRKYQQGQLVQQLQKQMHTYYLLACDTKEDIFYLICPELDSDAAAQMGQQMSDTITTQTHIDIRHASASFPQDGFTFNKILKETEMGLTSPVATTSRSTRTKKSTILS